MFNYGLIVENFNRSDNVALAANWRIGAIELQLNENQNNE